MERGISWNSCIYSLFTLMESSAREIGVGLDVLKSELKAYLQSHSQTCVLSLER